MNNTYICDEAYEDLANAIIKQAAEDYRAACKNLIAHPKDKDARRKVAAIRHFFQSDWFSILTSLDPELLMQLLWRDIT